METYGNKKEFISGDAIVNYNCHLKHELNPYYYRHWTERRLSDVDWGTSNGTLIVAVMTKEDKPREVFRDSKGRFFVYNWETMPVRPITKEEEDELEEKCARQIREEEAACWEREKEEEE